MRDPDEVPKKGELLKITEFSMTSYALQREIRIRQVFLNTLI